MNPSTRYVWSPDDIEIEELETLEMSPETEVHVAADKFYKAMLTVIMFAFAQGRKAAKKTALLSARTERAALVAMDGAPTAIRKAILKVAPPVIRSIVAAGGDAAFDKLEPRMAEEFRAAAKRKKLTKIAFDISNPDAVEWAEKHALELADGLSATSRKQIVEAVSTALESGDLGKAFGKILDAVGDPIRADMIARTEIMSAANAGQRLAWSQAYDEGLLTGKEKRRWLATYGACERCQALNGKSASLTGAYGGEIGFGPPLHPSCRCTEVLEIPRALATTHYDPSQERDEFGKWTKEGQTGTSGTVQRLRQHTAIDFPAGATEPAEFAEQVGNLLDDLSQFSGLQDISIYGMVLYNQKYSSESGKNAAGEYNPNTDRIAVAYGPTEREKRNNVEPGERRVVVGSGPLDQAKHEIGHHVWFKRLTEDDRKEWRDKVYSPLFGKLVSQYSDKNAVEGFAEAFSVYVSGGGRVLPPKARDFFKQHIGMKSK